jgi:hypothetical protein
LRDFQLLLHANVTCLKAIPESHAMRSMLTGSVASQHRGTPNVLSLFMVGLKEGFAKALQYQRLVDCSARELATIRVTHQDLPRFVMFGQP